MNPFFFTYVSALFAVICLVYAGIIIYRRHRRPVIRYLVMFIVFAGLWAFSNSIADISITPSQILFWSGMALLTYAFFAACFFHFVHHFVVGYQKSAKWQLWVVYSLILIVCTLGFTRFSYYNPIPLYTSPALVSVGPMAIVSNILFYLLFLASYFLLWKNYRNMKPEQRYQTYYIIAGSLGTTLGAIVFTLILPLLGNANFYSTGPVFNIFLITGVSYAIFKHRLLDIKIVIQRSLIYILLISVIVGFYLALLYLAFFTLNARDNDILYLVTSLITALAGIFSVPRLEHYFRKFSDRIFFKERYNYAEALHILSQSLNRNLDLKILMQATADDLQKIFKVSRITIATFEPWQVFRNGSSGEISKNIEIEKLKEAIIDQPQIVLKEDLELKLKDPFLNLQKREQISFLLNIWEEYNYKLMIKFLTSEKSVGVMVMSGKLSGDRYAEEDIQLLQTFSHQAAVAIKKSLLYEQTKDYATNLEEKVQLRTEELQNLQEGQKHMIEDISHGLQTPLTILKNELSGLSKTHPQAGPNLTVIEKSIDYVSNLIYALLRLSRLEAVGGPEEKKLFNFSEMLNDVAEYLEVVCEHNGILLQKEIKDGILMHGDVPQIKELLQNLLGNAVRYTLGCPKKIIILELNENDNLITLKISDTGIGIEKEDIPRIFDRFYRSEKLKNPSIKGTGLGLAICQQIAKNHGARLTAKSELGKGSTFSVEFKSLL
jgi:signal transduction histidine kinase